MHPLHKAIVSTLLGLVAAHSLADTPPPAKPVASIESLDVARYMGRWYEISRYPTWFQKKCRDSSRAEYALKDNGEVAVTNRCRLENGEMNVATAVGRQVGGSRSARLKVSFAPGWLSFLPMVWGDYWVVDIDPEYSLVAVSEPSREYLWVLSRTPQVDAARYEALLGRLAEQGFDLSRLITTKQVN